MENEKVDGNKLIQDALTLLAREERERKARTMKIMGVKVICMTQEEYLTGKRERLATW